MNTFLKIILLSVLMLAMIFSGTLGYHFLLGWSWVDALYMTVITITTVGFGEVRELGTEGRLLTIGLMVFSVGVFAYSLSTLGSIVMEARFGSLLWRRRMEKRINALERHYIICGFGRTGRAVCQQLALENTPFVVVEHTPELLELLREAKWLFVEGDATHDESLWRAGIGRAKGLVATLGNDAENVYLVLSARQVDANLKIVSWASTVEAERKVLLAGANHALSPYVQGGRRIANMLTSPHALEFLENAMGGGDNIRLGEIEVRANSKVAGHSLLEAGITRDVGVIIIGIRRAGGKLEFNPSADQVLSDGDILIGIGNTEQIERLRQLV